MNKLGVPFKNLSLYNASMRKGLEDKLFFLEMGILYWYG